MAIFDRFKSSKQKGEFMRPTETYTIHQNTVEPRSFMASLRRANKTPVDSSKVEPSFLDHISRPTETYTTHQSTIEPRTFEASLRRENKKPIDSSKVEPSFLDHISRPTKTYTIHQNTVEYPTFENSLRKQRTVGKIESDDDEDSIFDDDTRNPSNTTSLTRLMRPTEAYLSKQNFVEERVVDPFVRT